MSETINDYLCELEDNDDNSIYDIKVIAFRACYTKYLQDIIDVLDNNNSKFKNKIIKEILKTHKKINNLIKSFNEDTNYILKEMFENRNNYCNCEFCDLCKYDDIISCINYDIYLYTIETTSSDIEAYRKLIKNISNQLVEFTNQKLT